MYKEISNISFLKSDYENHTLTDLTNCLRKASTKEEQKFFVKLLNDKRTIATKKVIN